MIRQQKKAAYASDREAQYDERAKRVAGSKIVIASILSKTVDAFRGMKPRAVFMRAVRFLPRRKGTL